jgi:hypothetical protein
MKKTPSAQTKRTTQSPIRLKAALPREEFLKLVKHVGTLTLDAITPTILLNMLIEKGVLSEVEVQQRYLDEIERRGM